MKGAGLGYFADRDPDAIAVIDSKTTWSRSALCRLINRLARGFMAAGLSKGDVIAIVAPNCAEFIAAYLAGVQADLFIVPVNWHLAENELAFIIADSGSRAVIVHEDLGPLRLKGIAARRAGAEFLISIGGVSEPGFVALDEFAAPHSSAPFLEPGMGRVMAYTSATTGTPKAVMLPARNAESALERIVSWHRSLGISLENDNVHLCASMLYHSAPLEGAIVALHMGHRVVLVDRWRPELLLQLIDNHKVTTTFMVPTMFIRLLKLPPAVRAQYSVESLRFVVHSGAPCPVDVKRQMLNWWGNVIWETYGAAEGQGVIIGPDDWLRYPGSVGRPIPGAAVRILGDECRELAPNRAGAIYLRPHTGDRFEYKGDIEKTRSAYCGEFITVGDVGYLNEDGYLYVCERSADLIVSSGMNIYPAEIEMVLVQHPKVADCAVVGTPHELLGQVPKAFVQLESGVEGGSKLTAELLQFLLQNLSLMKTPKRIEYVPRIPRDLTGKLYRRLLRGSIHELASLAEQ